MPLSSIYAPLCVPHGPSPLWWLSVCVSHLFLVIIFQSVSADNLKFLQLCNKWRQTQLDQKSWNNTSPLGCVRTFRNSLRSLFFFFCGCETQQQTVWGGETWVCRVSVSYVKKQIGCEEFVEGAAAEAWREPLEWIRSLQLSDSRRSRPPLRLFTLWAWRAAAESETVSSR